MSSPSLYSVGAGMHTKNMRVGPMGYIVPLYHPLRLAEEVALLDQVSGGRVNWGAGRGFDPTEHRVFGVEPKERPHGGLRNAH